MLLDIWVEVCVCGICGRVYHYTYITLVTYNIVMFSHHLGYILLLLLSDLGLHQGFCRS